ncbi:hypothetical protein HYV64_05635 [Candidatus Shapirobacteria bacterium]|nr:hypothetical protein [Candidatus Shapirobacteria bacterium]
MKDMDQFGEAAKNLKLAAIVKFEKVRQQLAGGGFEELGAFGAPTGEKMSIQALEIAAKFGEKPDLPIAVTGGQWQVKIAEFREGKEGQDLLQMIDAMLVMESTARNNGSYKTKPKLKETLDNFGYVCASNFTHQFINAMREKFAERMEAFSIGARKANDFIELIGLATEDWENQTVEEKMRRVYGRMFNGVEPENEVMERNVNLDEIAGIMVNIGC